jgi:hypothetical protein
MSDEIVNAITSNSLGEPIDEDELENELDELQQEQLDEQMLKTGTVPVSDAVHKLPSVGTAERMCPSSSLFCVNTNIIQPCQARSRPLKKMTRKPNFGNCRLRWPCEIANREI